MAKPYITGIALIEERMGVKESYSEEDFKKAGLPMAVSCKRCTTSMALASAALYPTDGGGYKVYCRGEC